MRYWKLFGVFFRTSVQTDMEYRVDFFTRILASFLGLLTTLGGLIVVFQYTRNIKGWTFAQIVVLLSVYYLINGVIEMFIAPNMRQIMEQVRQGTLDFVLLKPVNAQFLATFRQINIWNAANVVLGLGMTLYTIGRLSLSVSFVQIISFALTLLASIAIMYSFWLFLVTLTFFFTRLDNIEQVVWQAFEAGRYPVEIYPGWLRGTLTYIIPVALVITTPAQSLTGRTGPITVLIALCVATVLLTLSAAFWRFGLRHYSGASS